MNDIIRIGMDTSKSVFQLHGVNSAEQPALRKRLRRRQVMGFFEKLPATRMASKPAAGRIIGRVRSQAWGMRSCCCRRSM